MNPTAFQKSGNYRKVFKNAFYYVLNRKVTKENREMMYEAVWNSNRVAVSLSAGSQALGRGTDGERTIRKKPDAIENLTEFLLSI